MTETELIERARGGDPSAFRGLYDAHVDRIFRLAYRMTGEEDLAMDCTQEAFVRAYQRLDQFRGEAAFSTWLHSIAVSVTLNGLRRRDRHWKRELDLEDAEGRTAAVRAAEPSRVEPDLKQRLHRAVDALPGIYRTVFLMHDLEGYSHEEIAGALRVAVGTSKARLSRARAKLREALADVAEEYA